VQKSTLLNIHWTAFIYYTDNVTYVFAVMVPSIMETKYNCHCDVIKICFMELQCI